MKKITKIISTNSYIATKKKVAAYARVSRNTEKLMHSVSAQISYYSALIQNNPEWEYAGVYADYGISGTMMVKRYDFKRMIADCEAGKINIILTKSISRFARNTVDLLKTVRYLKGLGVEIRFEKEKINSLSEDGELMLTLLASFAEEESRSISENCKWGIRKRFQSGEIGVANKHLLGYKYDELQRKYVIIPEEAESVRWIFQMYIDGLSLRKIANKVNQAKICTVLGNKFHENSIRQLIFNEIYAGDIIRQKSYIVDPINKNKIKNNGELPRYYMTGCHEAIIDRNTYAKVKLEMERRAAMLNPTYCFTGKIHCEICGATFTRKKSKVRENYFIHWICRSKKEVGRTCSSINFKEVDLKKICANVLGIDEFDENFFESYVKKMVVLINGDIEFYLVGGEKRLWKNFHITDSRHIATSTDAFNGKIICEKCGNTYHRINSKWIYWYCMGKKKKSINCKNINYTDFQLRTISAHILDIAKFDEQIFLEAIDKIIVCENGNLIYHFFDGRVEKWQRML